MARRFFPFARLLCGFYFRLHGLVVAAVAVGQKGCGAWPVARYLDFNIVRHIPDCLDRAELPRSAQASWFAIFLAHTIDDAFHLIGIHKAFEGIGCIRKPGRFAHIALEEAGVKHETTVWCGAKASWDKGKSSLSVVAEDGGKAQISGEEAKKKLEALTEATRLRLMSGKKPVRLDVTIESKGNSNTIASVKESS